MKKFLYFTMVAITACCLLVSNPVQGAEKKDEWKNSKFDFKKVTIVPLEIWFDETIPEDAVRDLKIVNLVESILVQDGQQKLRRANYTIMTQNADEPQAYDNKLMLYIRQYGETDVWVPEKTRYVTTNRVIEVKEERYDLSGKLRTTIKKVTVPVTEKQTTPAHYEIWTTAGVEMQMLDKDGTPVWQLIDFRDSSDKRNPYSMTERILNRVIDKLVELKSK